MTGTRSSGARIILLAVAIAACDDEPGSGAASHRANRGSAQPSPDPSPTARTAGAEAEATGDRGTDAGSFEPPDDDDPLALRVHELAESFAEDMRAASRMYSAELDPNQRREYQAVLKPPDCYRIVATGAEGVSDLDLKLYDSRSVLVQRDGAPDPNPVLGVDRPLCPDFAGMYRIRLEMNKGRGPVRMRIFRTR